MTPFIKQIIDHTILIEGGFSNRRADRGGPTKYGITQKTWAAYTKRKPEDVTIAEMKALTKEQAADCYLNMFYIPSGVDNLSSPIIHITFDMMINHGPSVGIKLLQRGLSSLRMKGLEVDGRLGPKTIQMADELVKYHGAKKVVNAICDARQAFYNAIVDNDKTGLQKQNINGWTNRNKWFRENILIDEKVPTEHTVTKVGLMAKIFGRGKDVK